MEVWNRRDLVPPVLNTFACATKHSKDEIRCLISTITDALRYFESQASFDQAAAYVSRFCVHWDNRFYNMHGFRLIKQLNQSLLRYRTVDVVHMLSNFLNLLPDGNYLEKIVQLPTRGNLDYLLVRCQGLAKLFSRIASLSENAARFYVRFMSTGSFFNVCSLFLCLLAEVWYKSIYICQKIVQIYNKLYPFRSLLQNTAEDWPLGIDCFYPENLGIWLGKEYSQRIIACEEGAQDLKLSSDSNLFLLLSKETSDRTTSNTIDARINATLTKPTIETDMSASIPKAILLKQIQFDEGERIDRMPFAKAKQLPNKPHFDAQSVKSKFDVKNFLDEEKTKRRQNLSQAVTQNLADNAFNAFASSMAREMNRMGTKDLLQIFKQELTELIGRSPSGGKGKSKMNKRSSK
ncbi:uncharacterized protein LOC134228017 [Armigeres subalbatus]|uniref:uncharacterized protein LOC134228017 n=1 Tax=Armigeres subalbatus TaxID=124917 RepID=UPI002ED06292